MQASKGWVLVIGILLILAAGVVATVVTVRNTANNAILPIQQGNSSLQTQVANFLHPTPTVIPDPATIIHEVRSLARLETIQFSVEKVITAETAQGRFAFLFGDKLLFVAHGTVIAGVDLAKINAGDISVQNGVLNMRLPAAEIFVSTLDNANSYVYDRQTGVLTHGDMNLETTARRAAEDEIRKAALQDGILAEAQANAQEYLSRLFRDMGFQDVIFTQATPEPPD
jgi:hypothetical protein